MQRGDETCLQIEYPGEMDQNRRAICLSKGFVVWSELFCRKKLRKEGLKSALK